MARKLVVEIIGDASSLEKSFKQATNKTDTFGSSLKKVGKIAAFTVGGAALGGLAVVLKRGADEFNDAQKKMAQTNAVLKSTGRVAGVTSKHVTDLATSLSKMSGVDDEVIQGAENMLLSFTKVRNEAGKGNKIFDRATKVILDYSARTGKDATAGAQLFGKALNEIAQGQIPKSIRGLGKLSEATQKEIKAHLKAGDAAGAQGVLLKALEKRYGGAAKAAGSTLAGQTAKLQNSFDELAGSAFGKLVPAITKVVDLLNDLLSIFGGAGSASDKFQKALERMGVQAQTAKRVIDDLKETFNALKTVVVTAFNIMRPILEAWWKQIQTVVQLLDDLIHGRWGKIWGDAVQVVRKTVGLWKTILTTAIKSLGGIAFWIGNAVFHGIVRGLKGLAEKIIALIVAPINAIIRQINKLPFIHINEIGVPGGGGGGTGTAARSPAHTGTMPPATTGLAPTPHPVTGPPIGGRGAVAINGPITVVANNPNELIAALQRSARRQTGSRSGPYAGHTLGLT